MYFLVNTHTHSRSLKKKQISFYETCQSEMLLRAAMAAVVVVVVVVVAFKCNLFDVAQLIA